MMEQGRAYMRGAGVGVIGGALLVLIAAALWHAPAGVAQAEDSAADAASPLMTSGYDIWQYGTWYPEITGPGLDPNSGGIQIIDSSSTSSTLIVVNTSPLTATVTSARIMIDRNSSSDASGYAELGICEGKRVKRTISTVPLAIDTDPEFVWIDIPLVQQTSVSTIAPSEYLCIAATKTSAGTLDVDSVIQAAVRYWAAPSDYLYLSSIMQ